MLSLARDEKSIRIYFNQGLIDAVSADHHDERLGQYLIKAGFVRSGEIDSLVAKSRRKRISLGEAAVREKTNRSGGARGCDPAPGLSSPQGGIRKKPFGARI